MTRKKLIHSLTAFLLVSSIVISLCTCSGQAKNTDPFLYSGEYFKDYSNKEQAEYIFSISYAALAHEKKPKEFGVSTLSYLYGISELQQGQEYGKLEQQEQSNLIRQKAVPTNYSLIKFAQEYESKMKIDNTEAAKKHGKQFVVRASSLDAVMTIVFRRDVPVAHASVDGAEYIESEGLYVFDELQSPYQPFIEKGWELQFLNYYGDEVYDFSWDDESQGTIYFLMCIPLWYDKDGNIYDLYGDFIIKQSNPSHRLINQFEYNDLVENLKGNAGAFMGMISVQVAMAEDGVTGLAKKFDSVQIGKRQNMNYK